MGLSVTDFQMEKLTSLKQDHDSIGIYRKEELTTSRYLSKFCHKTSLRIMSTLSISLHLKYLQVDYKAAFIQALPSESEGDIYVTIP